MDYSGRSSRPSNGRRSPKNDITAPRRDLNTRISKSSRNSTNTSLDTRQLRQNQAQEDEESRKWVSQEDSFVLKQQKKKAAIRVREGRAKPIDSLAVILRIIDPDRDLLDDDEEEVKTDVVDPEGVFEGLNDAQLAELETEIRGYLTLETNKNNQDYWRTMQIICKDSRQKLSPVDREGREVKSVSADIEKILNPKTYEELEALEKQSKEKLRSNDPNMDVDFWEQFLRTLLVYKAKAKLKKVYQSVLDSHLETLRQQQQNNADELCSQLQYEMEGSSMETDNSLPEVSNQPRLEYSTKLDPESLLKLTAEDKVIEIADESVFLNKVVAERRKALKLGYIPESHRKSEKSANPTNKAVAVQYPVRAPPGTERFTAPVAEDLSTSTAFIEREMAHGVNENEEVFTGEEVVSTLNSQWADKYRPRKPQYYNRVQMGYEWNKYNQTHYDHDNPPPKVVQGYKFHIFYPGLIDKSKAPKYRIEREDGRRRGESFAAAGEEDTCLIRFIAGPPYEDIAFRIVDREWDYSAKRDRGFKSSFDKVC